MKYTLSHYSLLFFLITFTTACGKSKSERALLQSASHLEHVEAGGDEYSLVRAQNENLWCGIIMEGLVICPLLTGCCFFYYRRYKWSELSVAEKELDRTKVELQQMLSEVEHVFTKFETLCHTNNNVDKCIEKNLNRCKLILSIKNDFPEMKELDIRSLCMFQSLQKNPCKTTVCTSADWDLLFLWTDMAHCRFYTRLKVQYTQLKKRDLQICCLIRLGFDHNAIRQILDIQQDTYYTDKSHTKKRLLLEYGTPLDDFIRVF